MQPAATDTPQDGILAVSQGFSAWLDEGQCSLALSSFDRDRLFFVGLRDDGAPWIHERQLEGCRGLWAEGEQLWISTLYQLWNFRNILPRDATYKDSGADRYYCPRVSFVTGALNIHEMAMDRDGHMLFVNTQYSCLARPDIRASFSPYWKPDFISDFAPEDRCHLNGLAMERGVARYVTARARSDVAGGWKDSQADGGLLISVVDNEIVSDRLSMPHSPRCHGGQVWLLNAGSCELGLVDVKSGRFEPVCFVPGYARGLAMAGDFAVIGLSLPRDDDGFAGLPLSDVLADRKVAPICGCVVVDLRSGRIVHWLNFRQTVREIMNVAILPGIRQPAMLGFKNTNKAAGTIVLPVG